MCSSQGIGESRVEAQDWPGEGCLCKSNVRGVEDAGSGNFLAGRSKRAGARASAGKLCGLGGDGTFRARFFGVAA